MERRRFLHAFQRGLFSLLETFQLISWIKGARLRIEAACEAGYRDFDCFPGSITGKMVSVKNQLLRAN